MVGLRPHVGMFVRADDKHGQAGRRCPQVSRTYLDLGADVCCGRFVIDLVDASPTDPDELFTAVVNLVWQLHYMAGQPGLGWAAEDLLVAAGELSLGPWEHQGRTADVAEVPFTSLCVLLDRSLEELHRVSPGFGARVAIAKARGWLDPDHQS